MGDNTTTNLYATSATATDPNGVPVDYDGPPPATTDCTGYTIREEPYGTKRNVKVLLMGAGASSLNFFKKAEEEMQNLDIICYEKNKDVGGTWLENRYPGVLADFLIPCIMRLIWRRLRMRYPVSQLSVFVEDQALESLLLLLARDSCIPQGN